MIKIVVNLRRYLSLVLPFIWQDKRCLLSTAITGLLTFLDGLIVPLIPWLFSELVRRYPQEDPKIIAFLTLLWIACWLLSKTLKRLRGMVFFHVVNEAIRTIRLRLVTHFHHIALEKGLAYDPSEVLSASTRVSSSVRFFLRVSCLNFIPAIFKLTTCGIAMYYAFHKSKYFLVGVLLTYLYLFFALRKFIYTRQKMWDSSDKVMVAMGDSLKQRDFAQLHPAIEEERLIALFDEEQQRVMQDNLTHHTIYLVQHLLFFVVASPFFVYCVQGLQQGLFDLPTFILLKGYLFEIYKQVFSLTNYIRGSSAHITNMEKVLDIFSITRLEKRGRGHTGGPLHDIDPVIQLDGVTFGYPKAEEKLFDHLSLRVHKGQTIVITGPSGSGKSTLAKLLAGIYLPNEGEVWFKGVSTKDISPEVIGNHLYLVGQDDLLIAGSLRDKLMLGHEEELEPLHYLQANLDDQPRSRPFSAGERQRILLTRCLSYKPEIVILDEAFSHLDQVSGRALFEMVRSKVPTVIVMTHRASFFENADRFYELGG